MIVSARPATVRPVARRPITGRHVLIAISGFFVLVTAVNGIMVYKAMSTFGGLDTPDAYRRGLAYNQRIALDDAQARLGWQNDVSLSPDKSELIVRLKDRDGAPVAGLNLTGVLGRSATNKFDRTMTLSERTAGIYAMPVAGLGPGTWIVTITAARAGASDIVFAVRRRLWLTP